VQNINVICLQRYLIRFHILDVLFKGLQVQKWMQYFMQCKRRLKEGIIIKRMNRT